VYVESHAVRYMVHLANHKRVRQAGIRRLRLRRDFLRTGRRQHQNRWIKIDAGSKEEREAEQVRESWASLDIRCHASQRRGGDGPKRGVPVRPRGTRGDGAQVNVRAGHGQTRRGGTRWTVSGF